MFIEFLQLRQLLKVKAGVADSLNFLYFEISVKIWNICAPFHVLLCTEDVELSLLYAVYCVSNPCYNKDFLVSTLVGASRLLF